ncbi:MAG: DUF922 domain-containing protein [Bacteroidetes bacterium]|nr:DUF922 domain-containing protein [Bacteroidota bacterium]
MQKGPSLPLVLLAFGVFPILSFSWSVHRAGYGLPQRSAALTSLARQQALPGFSGWLVKQQWTALPNPAETAFARRNENLISPEHPAATRVIWRQETPLTWADFRGNPEPHTGVDALSSCGLTCDPELSRNGELRFDVMAFFSPTDSWVDEPDASGQLLKHEQGHFDIGEIYARKMRRRLARTSFERNRLNQQISAIYDQTFNEFKSAQEAYDEVTEHSTHPEAQKEWNRWIADELKRYEAYRSRTVRARLLP